MGITVELPEVLLPYADGAPAVTLEARCRTVGDALGALAARHAGIVDRVVNERGEVRRHVNIFVDGDDIRFLHGLGTAVEEGSTLTILAAVSGG